MHPDKLGSLLSESYIAFFRARKNLLVSRLTEQVLVQIYTEEFDLYLAFFGPGRDRL